MDKRGLLVKEFSNSTAVPLNVEIHSDFVILFYGGEKKHKQFFLPGFTTMIVPILL